MTNNPNQRDADNRFILGLLNLNPVTNDPTYPQNGDSWFRVDLGIIKIKLNNVIFGLALIDTTSGKLIPSQIPQLIINHVFVVNSQSEQVALSAVIGDVAIRTDQNLSYILTTSDPTQFSNWAVLSNITASVSSVNGFTGVVNLTTTDIPEGSNLYYTNSRFNTQFSTKSTSDLSEGSNLYYTNSRFDTRFNTKSTDNLSEGTVHFYYTDTRFDTRFSTKNTDNLAEGITNLYYTQTRFNTAFAGKTTSNLTEGTNLYYTNTRFDAQLATKTTTNIAEGSNLYYTTARSNTDFDIRLSTKSTSDLTEGTNLYFTNARADARISAQKGLPNGLATLDGSGTIPPSQLPGEVTTTIYDVASQAAMLALSASKGDLAKRTDTNVVYILTTTPASTLGNWELLQTDYLANVESVNSKVGVVVLSTTDIGEGTNLYYTDARFDSRLSTKTTDNLTEGISNLYYTTARFDSRFATKTTSDLTEGSNLYYTTARANADFDTRLATKSTTNLAEGTNLYYTTARANADFDTRLATKTTDNLAEGSINLYYTNTRFDTRFSTKTTTNLTEGTNLYYTDARADARISIQKGAANGLATLDSGGKIPSSQLPAIAITDTFVVSSQAAMLAVTAETGDVAIRTDVSKSFILQGSDPTILGNWQELLNPGDTAVQTVNTHIGPTVVLTTSDIAEGTNLYYTDSRFDTRFGTKTTTNLAEGTNLYYTQARFDSAFAAKSTTNLTEGTNLYYTQARFDSAFAAKTTTNLSEGTNLYYTDTRVRANRLDQMAVPTSDLNINSHKLTNVTDPTSLQDAATKAYVDYKVNAMTSPAQITSNQNDYNPGSGRVFRLTSDVNNRGITGLSITGVQDGQQVILINVNPTNLTIILNNQDTNSMAANRFQFSTNANLNLKQFNTLTLMYDATTQRWRDI